MRMRHPCLLPTLGFAAGILTVEQASAGAIQLLAWLLVLVFLAARCAGWMSLAWFIGWAGVGGLAWWTEQTPLDPQDVRIALESDPVEIHVRGILLENPTLRLTESRGRTQAQSSVSVRLVSYRKQGQDLWVRLEGNVLIHTRGTASPLLFSGQRIEVHGVLKRPMGAMAPGLWDAARQLRYQGISHLLEVDSFADWSLVAGEVIEPSWSARFLPWAQKALSYGIPDSESTRLLWAMTLGWKTAMTDEVNTTFSRSGTLHVFAISGLHIALVAGVLLALLRWLRWSRAVCGLLSIPVIWFYVAATGWQSSAVRSAVMMTVIAGSWAWWRPADSLNSLSLSAGVILVASPGQLFQPGFQLSFAAVAGLTLFVQPWSAKVREWIAKLRDPFLPDDLQPRWIGALEVPVYWVAQSILVSMAALLATLPLLVHHFHQLSSVSLIANAIVVPLSAAALTANVGALLVYPVSPDLAGLFNASAWFWMTWMTACSRAFGQWSWATTAVPSPPWWMWSFYYAILVVPWKKALAWWKKQSLRCRANLGLICGVWITLVCVLGRGRSSVNLTLFPEGLLVVDGPLGVHDLVINSGGRSVAKRVLIPWIQSLGWNRIPMWILTQADAAHVGGAVDLMAQARPELIWSGFQQQRSSVFRQTIQESRRYHIPWQEVSETERIAGWKILMPDRVYSKAEDNGLGLWGEFEGVRILILPELGPDAVRWFSRRLSQENLGVDLLITEVSTRNRESLQRLASQLNPRGWICSRRVPQYRTRESKPFRMTTLCPIVLLEGSQSVSIRLQQGRVNLVMNDGSRLETW